MSQISPLKKFLQNRPQWSSFAKVKKFEILRRPEKFRSRKKDSEIRVSLQVWVSAENVSNSCRRRRFRRLRRSRTKTG